MLKFESDKNEGESMGIFKKVIKKVIGGAKCEGCGSEKNVKRVYVSDFLGKGSYKYLCAQCRQMEKLVIH